MKHFMLCLLLGVVTFAACVAYDCFERARADAAYQEHVERWRNDESYRIELYRMRFALFLDQWWPKHLQECEHCERVHESGGTPCDVTQEHLRRLRDEP